MERKHLGRTGPTPMIASRWLAPIDHDAAVVLAALVLAESYEEIEHERLGRPPTDAWDILIAGLVMGMTGLSARQMERVDSARGFSHRTLSRRLADDLLPTLKRAFATSSRLASEASPRCVVLQTAAPILPQLVAHVGIGRARRRNDQGLLVDALCRSIGVNMKIYAEHVGLFADDTQTNAVELEPIPAYLEF